MKKAAIFILVFVLGSTTSFSSRKALPALGAAYPAQESRESAAERHDMKYDAKVLQRADEIARRIMIIDCHSHNLMQPRSETRPKQVALHMLKKAGVKGIVQSFPLDFGSIADPAEDIPKNIEETKNRIRGESMKIAVARESGDFISPRGDDTVTVLLALEYFKGIFDGRIELAEKYHAAGVREIGLVRAGGPDSVFAGDRLTRFGIDLICELNRLGIICDITHMPPSAQEKVIEASRSPVILSHTAAFGLINSEYNVADSILVKLAAKEGIVCVTFFSGQLSEKSLARANEGAQQDRIPRAGVEELVDQIDYMKKTVGIDHVGIGSDYGGSGRISPEGLETIEGFPLIIYHMLKRGYTEDEIEKVMGLNFIRFFEKVENEAGRRQVMKF